MKENGIKFHKEIPDMEKEVYWCCTIWWKKEKTTNACWICSPNIPIIITWRCCICLRICYHPENMPRAFLARRIKSCPSRIREINWGWEIYCCKPFPRVGKRSFGYMLMDLHPGSSDQQRIPTHLLKEEGCMRCHQFKDEDQWTLSDVESVR